LDVRVFSETSGLTSRSIEVFLHPGEQSLERFEINGLVTPQSNEAKRICQEDLNEVITAFVQDKPALEKGLFDDETVPEELTQVRMGKIVNDRYPELSNIDQEAIRQQRP
ncbi:hypothetical protein ACC724_37690, partial [Rhizobium ruizarguesonis]